MKRDSVVAAYVVIGISVLLLAFVVKVELVKFSIAFLVGGLLLIGTIFHQIKRIQAARAENRDDEDDDDYVEDDE